MIRLTTTTKAGVTSPKLVAASQIAALEPDPRPGRGAIVLLQSGDKLFVNETFEQLAAALESANAK